MLGHEWGVYMYDERLTSTASMMQLTYITMILILGHEWYLYYYY